MKYTSLIKPPNSKMLKSGRVILESGEDVGSHITENKEEIIVVLKGTATIIIAGKEFIITAGNHHYIGPNIEHNIRNDANETLEYIYVVALFDGVENNEHTHTGIDSHVHKH